MTKRGRPPRGTATKKQWAEKHEILLREKELPLLKDFRSNYSLEEILSAVLAYSLTNNAREAARLTGVHDATIRCWKMEQPWWDEAVAYVRKVKQDELDAKFTAIIHSAASHLEERLIKDPNSVTTKELVSIANTVFDKRNLVRGEATTISRSADEKGAVLESLKHSFEQMSEDIRDRLPPSRVIKEEPKVLEGEIEDGKK